MHGGALTGILSDDFHYKECFSLHPSYIHWDLLLLAISCCLQLGVFFPSSYVLPALSLGILLRGRGWGHKTTAPLSPLDGCSLHCPWLSAG